MPPFHSFAAPQEWDLEAAAAEGQQFDLLQLCSAAARASEEAEGDLGEKFGEFLSL